MDKLEKKVDLLLEILMTGMKNGNPFAQSLYKYFTDKLKEIEDGE